jgi:predicted flap endonuclease-1-like 5' DNA nuclease
MADLTKIEGVGKADAQKLEAAGISTAGALVKQGADPQGRRAIAAQTGISDSLILRWLNHIDLFRIKGVGDEYANLLVAAGVRTVRQLARRNPKKLCQKMVKLNQAERLVRKLPSLAQVKDWVAQAKRLPRVITQ